MDNKLNPKIDTVFMAPFELIKYLKTETDANGNSLAHRLSALGQLGFYLGRLSQEQQNEVWNIKNTEGESVQSLWKKQLNFVNNTSTPPSKENITMTKQANTSTIRPLTPSELDQFHTKADETHVEFLTHAVGAIRTYVCAIETSANPNHMAEVDRALATVRAMVALTTIRLGLLSDQPAPAPADPSKEEQQDCSDDQSHGIDALREQVKYRIHAMRKLVKAPGNVTVIAQSLVAIQSEIAATAREIGVSWMPMYGPQQYDPQLLQYPPQGRVGPWGPFNPNPMFRGTPPTPQWGGPSDWHRDLPPGFESHPAFQRPETSQAPQTDEFVTQMGELMHEYKSKRYTTVEVLNRVSELTAGRTAVVEANRVFAAVLHDCKEFTKK